MNVGAPPDINNPGRDWAFRSSIPRPAIRLPGEMLPGQLCLAQEGYEPCDGPLQRLADPARANTPTDAYRKSYLLTSYAAAGAEPVASALVIRLQGHLRLEDLLRERRQGLLRCRAFLPGQAADASCSAVTMDAVTPPAPDTRPVRRLARPDVTGWAAWTTTNASARPEPGTARRRQAPGRQLRTPIDPDRKVLADTPPSSYLGNSQLVLHCPPGPGQA